MSRTSDSNALDGTSARLSLTCALYAQKSLA